MKTFELKLFASSVFACASIQLAQSQGSFQNLDFEQANIIPIVGNPYYPHAVDVANALPGWRAYIGSTPETVIHYDDISLGAAWISIHDANGYAVLDGNYTVFLQPNSPSGSILPAISQTGMIPGNALSLRFYGSSDGLFNVSFAGQQILISCLATTPGYSIYGGDISAFAGQTGELRFQGGGLLDNIQFSSQAVPEPGLFGFCAVGALLIGWRFRRKK